MVGGWVDVGGAAVGAAWAAAGNGLAVAGGGLAVASGGLAVAGAAFTVSSGLAAAPLWAFAWCGGGSDGNLAAGSLLGVQEN